MADKELYFDVRLNFSKLEGDIRDLENRKKIAIKFDIADLEKQLKNIKITPKFDISDLTRQLSQLRIGGNGLAGNALGGVSGLSGGGMGSGLGAMAAVALAGSYAAGRLRLPSPSGGRSGVPQLPSGRMGTSLAAGTITTSLTPAEFDNLSDQWARSQQTRVYQLAEEFNNTPQGRSIVARENAYARDFPNRTTRVNSQQNTIWQAGAILSDKGMTREGIMGLGRSSTSRIIDYGLNRALSTGNMGNLPGETMLRNAAGGGVMGSAAVIGAGVAVGTAAINQLADASMATSPYASQFATNYAGQMAYRDQIANGVPLGLGKPAQAWDRLINGRTDQRNQLNEQLMFKQAASNTAVAQNKTAVMGARQGLFAAQGNELAATGIGIQLAQEQNRIQFQSQYADVLNRTQWNLNRDDQRLANRELASLRNRFNQTTSINDQMARENAKQIGLSRAEIDRETGSIFRGAVANQLIMAGKPIEADAIQIAGNTADRVESLRLSQFGGDKSRMDAAARSIKAAGSSQLDMLTWAPPSFAMQQGRGISQGELPSNEADIQKTIERERNNISQAQPKNVSEDEIKTILREIADALKKNN
jgi:hypothetical protein